MAGDEYDAEQALIEEIASLDVAAPRVRLRAGRGASGSDVQRFLERVRSESPQEPLWRGVRRMSADGGNVEIEWHEPLEPRLLDVGTVQVECHLYDEDALGEAESRRVGVSLETTLGEQSPPNVSSD